MANRLNQYLETHGTLQSDSAKIARIVGIGLAFIATIEVLASGTNLLADAIHNQAASQHTVELAEAVGGVATGLVVAGPGATWVDAFISGHRS